VLSRWVKGKWRGRWGCVLLWPYLDGSEEAPATAKRGEEKKVFSAASISASRAWPRVVGMNDELTFLEVCRESYWVVVKVQGRT
jgi:hypothetical protein